MAENPKTSFGAKPQPTVGRTPYDAVVELFYLLGNSLPYIVILAMFVYSFVKISESYQQARVDISEEYAQRVEALNQLLQSSFSEIDRSRKSQIEILEKFSQVNKIISVMVAENQENLNTSRTRMFDAQQKLQDAQTLANKLKQTNKQLEKQTWAAESLIDQARRLAAFVSDNKKIARDRRYLSRRFESADVSGVSRDSNGNVYYGIYRVPANQMNKFIKTIKGDFPIIAVRLEEQGGQKAAVTREDAFVQEWLSLTKDRRFAAAQNKFVADGDYAGLLENIRQFTKKSPGCDEGHFDPEIRSTAMEAVIWSVAVQHGPRTPLVRRSWDGIEPCKAGDDQLIEAIYAERRKTEVYFPDEPKPIHGLLATRYKFEAEEALKMLKQGKL